MADLVALKSFLKYDNPSKTATSFKVGSAFFPAPAFIPEIKGEDDLVVLLEHMDAIPKNNPIIVPANKWWTLIKPMRYQFDLGGNVPPIQTFMENYSLIFFDPPEFFRYVFGERFVDYALSGSKENKKAFRNKLENNDPKGAINLAPKFFQPFIETQLPNICKSQKIEISNNDKKSDLERAWLDPRVDEFYRTYILSIVTNALKIPNATIIPPVPQLQKDTSENLKDRIKSTNRATAKICNSISSGNKQIFPYFHLYIDTNIFDGDGKNNSVTAFRLLDEGINKLNEFNNFSGVAITFSDYEKIVTKYKTIQMKNFVNEIVNLCREHVLPLPIIFPRSSWYGLSYTDLGIQAFCSLLNGKPKYPQGTGGDGSEIQRFGMMPLIERCIDVDITWVRSHLNEFDEFPYVEGLPRRPHPSYLTDPRLFQIKVSKPMRLLHIEEARRMRKAIMDGTLNPAKHYLSKSENIYLQNL
jgi:hypothetical protein